MFHERFTSIHIMKLKYNVNKDAIKRMKGLRVHMRVYLFYYIIVMRNVISDSRQHIMRVIRKISSLRIAEKMFIQNIKRISLINEFININQHFMIT